jgi:hypothetical protein
MKKLSIIIAALVLTYCVAAQLNYLAAMQDARQSIGTDSAIEEAMQLHGYNVDAMDSTPITFGQKLAALFPY